MATDAVTISAKYVFNDEEKRKIGDDLAKKHLKKSELAEAKKVSAARMKEQIDTLQNEINGQSICLANGYEYRDYKCKIEYDFKTKMKKFIDIYTGKVVDVRDFEPEDYQRKLPIDTEKSEKKDKAA